MLYRTMPKNGDRLSALGFGCMRLPVTAEGDIDEARAIAQVRQGIDSGINYVDTAWPYHSGASEPFLGKALADGYRAKARLATKLPTWIVENRADMDKFLNAQLERLRTDHIDYYLVHTLDGTSWDRLSALGVTDFLDAAKKDGRIVNAGFSFHGLPGDFNRIVDGYAWEFCQIQYNYLDETFQAGTAGLKYAASKGMGVIIMEPLRGGNLGKPVQPPAVAAIFDEAEVRRPPVEWALRWVWNHPEVTVVLSGMNNEEHIVQNLAIANEAEANSLSAAELDIIERASRKYKELMQVGCTGCAYCMPCPAGVNIPACFDTFNRLHMFGPEDGGQFFYVAQLSGVLPGGNKGLASMCVGCGECLEKCPQSIPVPDVLEKVAAVMEGEGYDKLVEFVKHRFATRPE